MAVRPGWRQQQGSASRPLPVSTGYHRLDGVAEYVEDGPRLLLSVTPRHPIPGNRGPTLQHRRIIHWPHGRDRLKIKRVLEHELQVIARLMAERVWPARDLYIDRCNVTGVDLDEFTAGQCATCSFPYCTLRS